MAGNILKLNCLKINSAVFSAFLFDLLFYASAFVAFLIFYYLLTGATAGLQNVDYANLLTSNLAAAQANLSVLQMVFVKIIFVIFLFLFCILLLFTLFKGIIWTKLTRAKFTLEYCKKTFLANLIYGITFLVLLVYSARTGSKFLLLSGGLVLLYLDAVSYSLFSKETGLLKVLRKTFQFSFRKAGSLILPCLFCMALFLFLFILINLILGKIFPLNYVMPISLFFALFYIPVIRCYFANVIHEINNEK